MVRLKELGSIEFKEGQCHYLAILDTNGVAVGRMSFVDFELNRKWRYLQHLGTRQEYMKQGYAGEAIEIFNQNLSRRKIPGVVWNQVEISGAQNIYSHRGWEPWFPDDSMRKKYEIYTGRINLSLDEAKTACDFITLRDRSWEYKMAWFLDY